MMRKQKRRLLRIAGLAAIAFVIITIVAVANYRHLERQAARIPVTIRRDLTFSPFIVTLDNDKYKATDYKLADIDKDVQLLSFIVHMEGKSVTVSEYPQPPQFTEIPEFKQRFLDNTIRQYASVQTANGTIYLGKQVKQDNKQLGIMLERGLIVLFNPKQELSQAEWRRLGDQFDIQRITN
jgi:hypothetical protein